MKAFLNTMGVIVAVAVAVLTVASIWTGDARWFGTATVLFFVGLGLFATASCVSEPAKRYSEC